MRFEFATTSRIIFGQGTLKEVPALATRTGGRPLVVTGKNTERVSPLLDLFQTTGMHPFIFSITGEPTVEMTLDGVHLARKKTAMASSAPVCSLMSWKPTSKRCSVKGPICFYHAMMTSVC